MNLANLVLYETEFQRIKSILAKVQKELGAELVVLISRSGQLVVAAGADEGVDVTGLASLAAANLAATDGLAQLVGEKEFSVLYHQGKRRSLHISDLLKRYSLVLLFDASASLGFVRWKVRRTTALLEDVFRDFQRRMEARGTSSELIDDHPLPPNFSDDELEQLLGRKSLEQPK